MPTDTAVLHTSEETNPTLEQLKTQLEDAKKVLKAAQDHEGEVKANDSSSDKDKKDAAQAVTDAQAKVDDLTSKVSVAEAAAAKEEEHTEAHSEAETHGTEEEGAQGAKEATPESQPSSDEATSKAKDEKASEDASQSETNPADKLGGAALALACGAYRML